MRVQDFDFSSLFFSFSFNFLTSFRCACVRVSWVGFRVSPAVAMAPRGAKPRGLARDFADVVSKVTADYVSDRRLCFTLALAGTSLALFTAHQTSALEFAAQFKVASAARSQRRKAHTIKQELKGSHTERTRGGDAKGGPARDEAIANSAPSTSNPTSAMVATKQTQQPTPPPRKTAAVDALFLNRLTFILKIVVPNLTSKEATLLYIQSLMLVSRSFISLRIARKGGDGLRAVMERSWKKFFLVLGDFFVSGVCASVVNSSLKYLTNEITVSFRERLTERVHREYLSGGAYYRAAVLRVGNLDNADQRIADDLHQFCHTASDLFSRTFKPLLDVILSTHRMGQNMGYRGLCVLYGYFLMSGGIIKSISPPFSEYIAKTQKLEGDFRRAHSRLITHAEEVAFLQGAGREKVILNERLRNVTSWSRFYFYLQWKQGMVDQYFIKYFASMVGWPVLAFPFLADTTTRSSAEIASLYRESDTLIQSASSSIGDLMMVYKKLQRLSGFTARVVELLEAVDSDKNEQEKAKMTESPHSASVITSSANGSFSFNDVTVHSPDGRLLVKDLNLTLTQGENLFVSGANGAGKTSLFRVLAGLWAPSNGSVSRPSNSKSKSGDVFYVPQKPYLAFGTLRDQVIYPDSVEELLRGGGGDDDDNDSNASTVDLQKRSTELDEKVLEALTFVNLQKLVNNPDGLNLKKHDWGDVLSGGEKQRVGLARVFFRKPSCAVLDEATSAINPDEEKKFYESLTKQKITCFSIAHRPELENHHHKKLKLHADGTGGWTVTELGKRK